jgi:glycosyltransferase involved in cell wall biosynthesis
MAKEMRRQGCRVLVASLERGRVHHFHLKKRGPVPWLHYSLATRQVRTLVKRFRPDIVNAHFASGYGHLAALARVKLSPPLVVHLWGSDVLIVPHKSFLHRRKTIAALKAADHCLADSEYLLREARDLTNEFLGTVIPWGIETEYLSDRPAERTMKKPLRIIVPRTQAAVYNNEFIIDSLRDAVSRGELTLTFPDFGPEADRFRLRVGDLLGNGVDLYPRLSRGDFVAMLSRHDVYLSASRSDSSPASMIEAMGLGVIPVAADIPGVREWLTPETGFTFVQDDGESLRSALGDLVASDRLDEMRLRNLREVQRRAVFEDNVTETLRIMRGLL